MSSASENAVEPTTEPSPCTAKATDWASSSLISLELSLELKTKFVAAHVMIWASDSRPNFWENHQRKAAILMNLRFDGIFGFPGGLIDHGEDIETGLNRELQEEINLASEFEVTRDHHICSFYNKEKNCVLHFYGLQVSFKDFVKIEKRSLDAAEYGQEVLGMTRVPLFTMKGGVRGLPYFLANRFAGNARDELLYGLKVCKILTEEEIDDALRKAKPYIADI